MKNQRPLHGNVASLTIAAICANGVRFATQWLVAWGYGRSEHGQFAVVFGLVTMLVIAGEFGLISTFGVRQIALATGRSRRELNDLINRLSGVLLLINIVIGVVLLALAELIGEWLKVNSHLLRLAAVWPMGFVLYRITMMIANGLEAMHYSVRTTILFHLFWMVWIVICVTARWSLETLVAGFSVAFMAGATVSWLMMPSLFRLHSLRWRPNLYALRDSAITILHALPYSLPQMGLLILPGLVCLLIMAWQGQEQVSDFQICYSLAILGYLIALPLSHAILPRLTRVLKGGAIGQDSAKWLVYKSGNLLISFGTLVFGVLWLSGKSLLDLISDEHSQQTAVLLIIAGGVAFDVHRILIDQLLMASQHVAWVAASEIVRYVTMLGFAAWMIPRWGAVGAAWAVTISMMVNYLAKLVGAWHLANLLIWRQGAVLVFLLSLMTAVGYAMGRTWLVLAVWMLAGITLGVIRPIEWWRWYRQRPVVVHDGEKQRRSEAAQSKTNHNCDRSIN